MTHLFAQPQAMASAAQHLTGIGSAIRQANAAAAGTTTSVVAAAQDEVSAAIAALFGSYGQQYQALSARVAAFHEDFVQALSSGGSMYAATEADNGLPLTNPPVIKSVNGVLTATLTEQLGAVDRNLMQELSHLPGPTLMANPGDVLDLEIVNDLQQPTNLHTHGLRVSPIGDRDNILLQIEPGGPQDLN